MYTENHLSILHFINLFIITLTDQRLLISQLGCHSSPQILLHCLGLCSPFLSLFKPLLSISLSLSLPLFHSCGLRRCYISQNLPQARKQRGKEKDPLLLPSFLPFPFYTMRKHGWQLPYHPLQVSLSLSLSPVSIKFLHQFL